jgi:predicted RNA-binding Zn ribbon-like protein
MALSYSWLGKDLALDFANTVIVVRPGEELDGLAEEDGLARWLELERDRFGDVSGAEARLEEFRRLRDAIRALLATDDDLPAADVETVNRASVAAPSVVRLLPQGVVVESRADTPVDAVLGAIAAAAVGLLGGPDRDLVRVCEAPSCGLFFLAARERQQWCTPSCGNRARVARHYARRARTGSGRTGEAPPRRGGAARDSTAQ